MEEGEAVGYADLHPLPQLGDPPLKWHLGNENSPLWKRSLYYAKLDRTARNERKSLTADLNPRCHKLYQTFDKAPAEPIFKVKVGSVPDREIPWLLKHTGERRLRLDFNLKLSREAFYVYLESLAPIHKAIEFIEDPYLFHPEQWEEDQKRFQVPFALDFGAERGIGKPLSAPYLILKPMREDPAPFLDAIATQKVIVTSCLDHPLGRWAAAYTAKGFPFEVTGIFSDEVKPMRPLGYGFGQEFKDRSWIAC